GGANCSACSLAFPLLRVSRRFRRVERRGMHDRRTPMTDANIDAPNPKSYAVIATRDEYLAAVQQIAAGAGPVAVDAERASGYRYSQRAYLIQVFRRGAGTFLFDPPAIGAMTELNDAIRDV